MDFCEECFEASDFKEKRELPVDFQAALRAGCRYCGGEAHAGGLDPLALVGGVRKMSIMCAPCAKEYNGYLRLKLPGFGDPDLTKEQMAVFVASLKSGDFPAILTELENHMKQWVATRKLQ